MRREGQLKSVVFLQHHHFFCLAFFRVPGHFFETLTTFTIYYIFINYFS